MLLMLALLLLLVMRVVLGAAPAWLVLLLLGRLRRLAGLALFTSMAAPATLLPGRALPRVSLIGRGLLMRAPLRVSRGPLAPRMGTAVPPAPLPAPLGMRGAMVGELLTATSGIRDSGLALGALNEEPHPEAA